MIEVPITARLVRFRRLRRASIHDQGTAREFGFTGALVPGIDVMAWLMNLLCDLWGADWLQRGTIELKNIRPVCDAQAILQRVDPDGPTAKLEVVSEARDLLAAGSATLPDQPLQVNAADYPFRDTGGPLLRAIPGGLSEGKRLSGARVPTDDEFLDQLKDRSMATHALLQGDALHPLAFQQTSTWDSANSLEQDSPGIHAWSETINLRQAPNGAELASAGFIRSLWERKGNHYMQIEQLVTADGEPVALVRRTIIYSLAKATG